MSGYFPAAIKRAESAESCTYRFYTCTGFILSRALRAAHDRMIDRMFTPL